MGTVPTSDPAKKGYGRIVLIVLAVTIVGGWLAKNYFFDKPTLDPGANLQNDPLCEYVSNKLQLNCVVGLAAESVLGPGHFVVYSTAAATKVPFPDGDLFSTSCLVPGEHADTLLAALKRQEQENTVNIDEITYKLDRTFQAGVDLPFPRFHDLKLKAGPKMTEVQDIAMTADSAWIKIIDVNAFLDVIANAGIRKRCLDSLVVGQYSVISKALIANNVNITVRDKLGKSVSLLAAATNGQIAISGGVDANINVDQTIKTRTATPTVLGVYFFPPTVFKERPATTESVVYTPSGQMVLTVTGNGGQGVFPAQTKTAGLGDTAAISAQGSESSECQSGFERTASQAILNGRARSTDSQTIEYTVNGTIGGGHYATGTCVLGNLVGKVGHDNGVSAVSTFTGYIRTVVRSETAEELQLQTTGLPPESRIEVQSPNGELLKARNAPSPGGGDVTYIFPLRGEGVYIVQASWTIRRSVNGAGTEPIAYRTMLRAVVR